MNKETRDRLSIIAEHLPVVYKAVPDHISMSGADLFLTPLWEKGMDKKKIYPVAIPKYIAIEHIYRLRAFYSRNGWRGVDKYCASVYRVAGDIKKAQLIENRLKEK